MMNDDNQISVKRFHFGLLLLTSFSLFNLGFVIEQSFRWTDPFQGFMNGLFHIVFNGFAWSVFLLPWSLLIFYLYRRQGWKKRRTEWILAPVVFFFLVTVGSLVLDPPTAENRFENVAGTNLPTDLEDLRFHLSGGGLADYLDTYYFSTSSSEIDRLIREMNLEKDEIDGKERFQTIVSSPPGWPDFSTWPGVQQFRRDDGGWFYYLITDEAKTRAYIVIGSI